MQLKVSGRTIDKYNNVSVSLKYDAVGSTFAFKLYFDPGNANDKRAYQPGGFNLVEVIHNNELLITGVLLSQGFESSSTKQLTTIAGYSKTGVLEDCTARIGETLQQDGKSLIQIATQLIQPYGIALFVSDNVRSVCDEVFSTATMNQYETIKSFLSKLAAQKNVVISHTADGSLLFTQADSNKKPIYNFTSGTWITMSLAFDGQQMHDKINVTGQANVLSPNSAADSVQLNPYLSSTRGPNTTGAYFPLFRPIVWEQTASADVSTSPLTARKKLGNELKAIRLKIDINGWTLGGKIPRPGDIVTVTNPDIFLYQKTKWFIEQIDFRGDEKSDTATLSLVLPECFNNDPVVNIFTGTNLTVPYSPDPKPNERFYAV